MLKKIIFSVIAITLLVLAASNEAVYQFVLNHTGALQLFRYSVLIIALLCIFFMKSFSRIEKVIISIVCCVVFTLSEMHISNGGVL